MSYLTEWEAVSRKIGSALEVLFYNDDLRVRYLEQLTALQKKKHRYPEDFATVGVLTGRIDYLYYAPQIACGKKILGIPVELFTAAELKLLSEITGDAIDIHFFVSHFPSPSDNYSFKPPSSGFLPHQDWEP